MLKITINPLTWPLYFWGIIVFTTVVNVDWVVMICDIYLKLSNHPTITDYVITHLIWAIPIIGWQLLGVAGLFVHFYCRGKKNNKSVNSIDKQDDNMKELM